MLARPLVLALLVFVGIDILTPDPVRTMHGKPCPSGLCAFRLLEAGPSRRSALARLRPQIRPARPAEMGLAVPFQLEVQLCKDRWQEHLQPGWTFRIWRAGSPHLVAELPVPLVVTILGHYLSQAGLTAAVLELQPPTRYPLASAPIRAPLRALGVPLSPVQEMRRAARASRKGRAGRRPNTPTQ